MDNRSAQQVIAAIERLSNRIAKLDETGVESAAIANEARRAAMDAAEATSPEHIATHLVKSTEPVIDKLDVKLSELTTATKDGLYQATREAKEAASALGSAKSALHLAITQESCRADADQKRTVIAASCVVVVFCFFVWAMNQNSIKSTSDCSAFGGHPHVVEADDGERQIWCSIILG